MTDGTLTVTVEGPATEAISQPTSQQVSRQVESPEPVLPGSCLAFMAWAVY